MRENSLLRHSGSSALPIGRFFVGNDVTSWLRGFSLAHGSSPCSTSRLTSSSPGRDEDEARFVSTVHFVYRVTYGKLGSVGACGVGRVSVLVMGVMVVVVPVEDDF